MNTQKTTIALLGAALMLGATTLVACDDTEGTGGAGTTGSTTNTTGSMTTTTGSSTSTGTSGGFAFATDSYDKYTQIDRHGAVEAGTVGILASQGLGLKPGSNIALRDAYNKSNPEQDVAGMWVPEIVKSLNFLAGALDDDIKGAGLTPCAVVPIPGMPPTSIDKCVAQAAPVVVPDTIKYDFKGAAYPNGRRLEDQVVDITIAAALLDLTKHPIDVLAKLGLNPKTNDVPFKETFPFLADPH